MSNRVLTLSDNWNHQDFSPCITVYEHLCQSSSPTFFSGEFWVPSIISARYGVEGDDVQPTSAPDPRSSRCRSGRRILEECKRKPWGKLGWVGLEPTTNPESFRGCSKATSPR